MESNLLLPPFLPSYVLNGFGLALLVSPNCVCEGPHDLACPSGLPGQRICCCADAQCWNENGSVACGLRWVPVIMNTASQSIFTGIGAFASPLAATQFAQLPRWSFHYLISLGIAITNAISLIAVFRFKTQHGKSYLWPNLIEFLPWVVCRMPCICRRACIRKYNRNCRGT